jgi:hypothetical protein
MAKVGRPSEYKEAYCAELVSLMATGLSLTAAMAELGFHRDTAHEWAKHHPEFSDAMKKGQAKRTLFLERSMLGSTSGPEVTARIFALKNSAPEEWREKQQLEHSGPDGGALVVEIRRFAD